MVDHEEAIRNFLSLVDPEAGYIEWDALICRDPRGRTQGLNRCRCRAPE